MVKFTVSTHTVVTQLTFSPYELLLVQNGYSLPTTPQTMAELGRRLNADPALVEEAEAALRVGCHWSTSVKPPATHEVAQVYASAVPVAYAKSTKSKVRAISNERASKSATQSHRPSHRTLGLGALRAAGAEGDLRRDARGGARQGAARGQGASDRVFDMREYPTHHPTQWPAQRDVAMSCLRLPVVSPLTGRLLHPSRATYSSAAMRSATAWGGSTTGS